MSDAMKRYITAWAMLLPMSVSIGSAAEPADFQDRLAAATQLIKAEGIEDQPFQTFPDVKSSVRQSFVEEYSQVRHVSLEQAGSTVGSFFRTEAASWAARINEAHTRRIAEVFSLSEINRITAFYRSEVGRKIVAVGPRMAKKLGDDSRQIKQTVVARFYRLVLGLSSQDAVEQSLRQSR